jgi:hypothetical protein
MARPAHDYARVDRHVPVTRRAETAKPYSPVMILISVIAALGILLYAHSLLDPDNRGDGLPYALVIAAESVLVVHALLAIWTIVQLGRNHFSGAGCRVTPSDIRHTVVLSRLSRIVGRRRLVQLDCVLSRGA